jgi:hypothetical protein
MMRNLSRKVAVVLSVVLLSTAQPGWAQSVPKPLKSRLVLGDPVWRELPVRPELQSQLDKCWQTAVSTILENNFDIATMDRESGYIRTTWNEGVVVLGGNWYYKVQISVKLVIESDESAPDPVKAKKVSKVRLQVAGEVTQTSSKGLRAYFRGYDQVLLQNLLQDFQLKLGKV